jgi:transcriptional regulator with PAS, ATPase and Fis domain
MPSSSTVAISIHSLVEAQEAPTVVIDKDYKIIAANPAYCANYGVRIEDLRGRHCYEVSHRSPVPCHRNGEQCPHHEVFRTHQPFEVLHTHFDGRGNADHVRIKAHPLTDNRGNVFLMEAVHRLAPATDLTCEEMRMVGRSPAFLQCVESLSLAAKANAPVLVYGETGVGKELAARFIHEQSPRKSGPYVELNCAAIPEALTESELFGHERGAFTGCAGLKQGLFEQADGGTLFLDEIGEMPLAIQAKLLRVLDSGQFRRVGGHAVIRSDARVIAATNQDLLALAAEGRFREDLYFRIAGIEVNIPPLRERRDDIPALAAALVARLCPSGRHPCRLTADAIDKLLSHDYPGNVRELRNVLHKACAHARNGVIEAAHILFNGDGAATRPRARATARPPVTVSSGQSLEEIESRHIGELLGTYGGHRRTVANVLGISERTLYRKLNRYQLRK